MYMCIYIYIYIHVCIYIYIYTYTQDHEDPREIFLNLLPDPGALNSCMHAHPQKNAGAGRSWAPA